jgi:hypothetical protein
MIKILLGKIEHVEIKERFIQICNAFHTAGYSCVLYTEDASFKGRCPAQPLAMFTLEENDLILGYRLSFTRLSDFATRRNLTGPMPLPSLKKNKLKYKLLRWWRLKKQEWGETLRLWIRRNFQLVLLQMSGEREEIQPYQRQIANMILRASEATEQAHSTDPHLLVMPALPAQDSFDGGEAFIDFWKQHFDMESHRKSDITVVLNGFRRGKNLNRQLEALRNQTVRPDKIMLWYNEPGPGYKRNRSAIRQTQAAVSNENWGVWSRFYYALNAQTKYVCVFDDDTIPGSRWLENCLNTIQTNRGLLGTIGLIYHSDEDYYNHTRYGWDNPNETTQRVDIVGHSWFFEKEFLTAFCRELPLLSVKLCGEDIHFSYTLQKYMGLNTYVPPHPKEDPSLWGSLKGWEMGTDLHAISRQHLNHNSTIFVTGVNDYFRACIAKGWRLLEFEK